jgi:hypothetical protein
MIWVAVSAVSHGNRGNYLNFFNVANVFATRDNFRQTLLDHGETVNGSQPGRFFHGRVSPR